jgi:hypothetical protein
MRRIPHENPASELVDEARDTSSGTTAECSPARCY